MTAAILTAAVVCLSLAGCTVPHYNHRGEKIPSAAVIRTLQPTIVTAVAHVGR